MKCKIIIIGYIFIFTVGIVGCSQNSINNEESSKVAENSTKISEQDNIKIVDEKGLYNPDAEEKSNFIVILTNQSFENTMVNLTVYIDGNELISRDCYTENQHTGYYFYYNILGKHDVKVISDDGKEIQEEITFEENSPQWVMIANWTNEDGSNLEISVMDTPFLWN